MTIQRLHVSPLILSLGILFALLGNAQAATEKPNILLMVADDVGYWNLSHINRGMMGYQTPNIDRIAILRNQ